VRISPSVCANELFLTPLLALTPTTCRCDDLGPHGHPERDTDERLGQDAGLTTLELSSVDLLGSKK
jgi:hypothetical protein